MRKNMQFLLLLCIILFTGTLLQAAYLTFNPVTVTQPDGTKLDLFASGDEYYNWLHDKNGYTIKQNDEGWYVYLDKRGKDDLVFTNLIVDRNEPSELGLTPWINISPEKMGEIRSEAAANLREIGSGRAPTSGTINNIVIFIRFSDQSEYTQDISTYDSMFNGMTGNTMQSYFLEASYNALSITTSFYPTTTTTVVSWQDTAHPRGYYSPYSATNTIGYSSDSERTSREHTLLVNAVNGVSSQIPSGLAVDGDGDNRVDNVCFIIQGGTDAWASLLWPHRWSLYTQYVYINGKRVYDYNFQLSDYLTNSGASVLCHEMFHSLGAPDLYHYTSDGISPAGQWDLMCSNTTPPQHMTAFMKYKYGHWITSIPTLTAGGTYTLNPLTSSTGQCYRINSPNTTNEYYVLEFRKKTGTFENSLPGSGIIIYRINTTCGDGNADGPPDELYIYRLNGTLSSNGTSASANFSTETGRTSFNDSTNPYCFLSDGSTGGISISDISSSSGSTMSFTYNVSNAPYALTAESYGGDVYLNWQPPLGEIPTSYKIYKNTAFLGSTTNAYYTDSSVTPGITYNYYVTAMLTSPVEESDPSNIATITASNLDPEGFETGNFSAFPWTFSGNANWTIDTTTYYAGTHSARSGTITDEQTSVMQTTLDVTGDGYVSFWYKVSSEANYDFLNFYIDGDLKGSWAGEAGWSKVTYAVSAGTRTLKWEYNKDQSVSNGSDCAWVDNIIFPATYITDPANITWTPTEFDQELYPDQTDSQILTIGNTGDETLSYTVSKPTGSATVLDEGFENGGSIPAGWTQSYVSGSTSWTYTSGGYYSHPDAAYEGSYNARLFYGSSAGITTKLITPSLNLSGADAATLTFYHTQEIWYSDQDELKVYYGSSTGGPWTQIAYYNTSIASWTQETINLPNPSGTYYIAFEGIAKYGYGICLDNVTVTKSSAVSIPWLTVNGGDSYSGSIDGGAANQNISIGFNSAGLSPGTYNTDLTITSNSALNSSVIVPVQLTVNLLSLDAPVVAIQRDGDNINLSWAAIPNATSYKVYGCDTVDGTYELLTTVTQLNYNDTSGAARQFYRVVASTE